MTYKEKMQWNELERLLPKIRSSYKKEIELEKLIDSAKLIVSELTKKTQMLREATEIPTMLNNLEIESEAIKNEIITKSEKIGYECKELTAQAEKKIKRCEEIRDELRIERDYYRNISIFLKGLKIKKKQVTFEEFESLLYFLCTTGLKPEDLFEHFCEMYPWITYGFIKRNCTID